MQTIRWLATRFGTTMTACALRYLEATREHCALVVSSRGKVLWWRASPAFQEARWLETGGRLPSSTVAGALAQGGKMRPGPREVDLDAWVGKSSIYTYDDLLEEVLVMERYDKVLSLLELP